MDKRRGFSLVELLVVIAIVGVLAAIATPTFVSYRRRATVLKTFNSIFAIMDSLRNTYEANGAFQRSILVGNTTVAMLPGYNHSNGVSISSIPNVTDIMYSAALDYKGAAIGVIFDPSLTWLTGVSATQTMYFGLRDINDVLKFQCGGNDQYDGGIARQYWPSICTCNMVGYAWYDTRFMTDGNCH